MLVDILLLVLLAQAIAALRTEREMLRIDRWMRD